MPCKLQFFPKTVAISSIGLWGLLLAVHPSTVGAQVPDFTMAARNEALLEGAIELERPSFVPPAGVTGITVPHHLVAPDLIARGFWAASGGTYDRILLLAPDHFDFVSGSLALVDRDITTVFGNVPVDHEAVAMLNATMNGVVAHPYPEREHGIVALLPFIAHFFPDVPVVSVVIPMHAGPEDWARHAHHLEALATDTTLVVQSTDFSHYLSPGEATLHDQQTMAALAHASPSSIEALSQPSHLDAIGAQSIMLRLQGEVAPVIIANRNSLDYTPNASLREGVTSYLVAVYHPDPNALSVMQYGDHERLFVGGDLMLGRHVQPMIEDPSALAAMLDAVALATGGAPLLANLEGVMSRATIANAPEDALLMLAQDSLPVMHSLGVQALGLGNNHSLDLGDSGLLETMASLHQAGITALPDREVVDLGPLRVMSVNMVTHLDRPAADLEDLRSLCRQPARAPFIVLPHWGEEYTFVPGPIEQSAAVLLANCGVSAVIGAHSHQASDRIALAAGQMPWVFSLGNLIFDQRANRSSGALVELRLFQQGTMAMRLVPIPNLFEAGWSEIYQLAR